MKWDKFFFGIVAIFLIFLFIFYMGFSAEEIEFGLNGVNDNFSLEKNNLSMQFYENMRFPSSNITYSINGGCILQKKGEMLEAFEIVSNLTNLEFFEDLENPEITIDCDEKSKVEGGLFIAGEGGPTKIIPGNYFNVILLGKILLIRNSNCQKPNIAIHELLHVLGFEHSNNSNNIMYPVSKCKQTIGEEIPLEINKLYSTPSLPDLEFEDVLATVNGRMLNVNMTIKNSGLVSSKEAKIIISGENKIVKEIELEPVDIGYQIKISLANIWLTKLKIEELTVSIESNFTELSKDNNKISLTKS